MDKKTFTDLVKRYLLGKATPEERRWLYDYDSAFDNEPLQDIDSQKEASLEHEMAGRISQKINEENIQSTRVIPWPFLRLAAVMLLFAGLSWLVFLKSDSIFSSSQRVQFSEVQVPYGKIKKLTLQDGTQVTLNAGSRLRYPDHFSGSAREVWLTGEGFFDVTRQQGKPFTVNTALLRVNVLGTRFNVSAYQEHQASQVSVVEGKVSVQDLEQKNEKLLLLANEGVSYDADNKTLVKSAVNEHDVLAWQQGSLNFKNEPFKSVAAAMERKYGVNIQVDKAIEDCRIYANIGNEPVEKALAALAVMMQIKLSGGGKDFRFSGEHCQ